MRLEAGTSEEGGIVGTERSAVGGWLKGGVVDVVGVGGEGGGVVGGRARDNVPASDAISLYARSVCGVGATYLVLPLLAAKEPATPTAMAATTMNRARAMLNTNVGSLSPQKRLLCGFGFGGYGL